MFKEKLFRKKKLHSIIKHRSIYYNNVISILGKNLNIQNKDRFYRGKLRIINGRPFDFDYFFRELARAAENKTKKKLES